MSWEAVVGLEIHVQLKTRTKMFCRCENVWGEEPNTRTCPVCLAHPGTLPVPNRPGDRVDGQARPRARLRDRGARALPPQELLLPRPAEGVPDLPVRRARSASGGRFAVPGPDGDREIGIVRAHLEEDAAKTDHVGGAAGRIHGADDVARRLQPRRHAARRDRRRAGRPLAARRRAVSSSSCGRRSSSSGSPTPRWRRARSAATRTSPSARPVRRASARRPSSRT